MIKKKDDINCLNWTLRCEIKWKKKISWNEIKQETEYYKAMQDLNKESLVKCSSKKRVLSPDLKELRLLADVKIYVEYKNWMLLFNV